jgi:hypothetical protein
MADMSVRGIVAGGVGIAVREVELGDEVFEARTIA